MRFEVHECANLGENTRCALGGGPDQTVLLAHEQTKSAAEEAEAGI